MKASTRKVEVESVSSGDVVVWILTRSKITGDGRFVSRQEVRRILASRPPPKMKVRYAGYSRYVKFFVQRQSGGAISVGCFTFPTASVRRIRRWANETTK